jgi:hypothetical protein
LIYLAYMPSVYEVQKIKYSGTRVRAYHICCCYHYYYYYYYYNYYHQW